MDTFSIRNVDRYAEQLWDTMLAKAPQIMLFEYSNLLLPARPGNRAARAELPTSFNYKALWPHSTPDFAEVAGTALNEIDPIVGKLGNPVGVPVYRPLNSTGEDFLANYLGEIGIPVEMLSYFPTKAKTVLLTAAAAHDPNILAEIKTHLTAGGNVVITTGLLKKMPEKITQICELSMPGNQLMPTEYWGAYGAGNGTSLGTSDPLMVPEVDYFTNDAWPLVRGTATGRGAPLLLMDRYGKGVLYVLTIPDNFNDLYLLPQGVLTALRNHIGENLPETMVLQREGRVISLVPYAPNIVRITMSTGRTAATSPPGYGIIAQPSAKAWMHERDAEGYDVYRSAELVVRISPENIPVPKPMPLDALNLALRKKYFPPAKNPHAPHNDEISVATANGKVLLRLRN